MFLKKTLSHAFFACLCVVAIVNTENEAVKGITHASLYIAGKGLHTIYNLLLFLMILTAPPPFTVDFLKTFIFFLYEYNSKRRQ